MSELPVGWSLDSLESIVSTDGVISDGDWIESKDQDSEGNIRLVQLADVGDGCFKNKSQRFMNSKQAQRLNCSFLQEDDVLIARMPDPLGRACLFPKKDKECVTVVDICFVRVSNNCGINPNLLMSWINSPEIRNRIAMQATGTTRKRITRKKLQTLELPLPPLNEQIRIANKLDSLLGKLEATQKHLDKIPTLLKRFRQSVLAAAVSGALTAEWRKKNELSLTLRKEKLVNIIENIQIGPFGSLLHKSDYIFDGIPVINPMHIIEGTIVPSNNITISKEKYSELNRYHLEKGDVILGRRGEMGRAAVISNNQAGWLCGTGSLFLRFDKEILEPYFLWLVMTSPATIALLIKGSVGTTMVNLNQKILKNLEIIFPEIEEQKQIVHQVESLFNLADKVEQQYQAAKQRTDKLTQSILAKAFRGELVPQDPHDEPASELLKRIKKSRA